MSRRRRNKVRPAKARYADGFRRFLESFAGEYRRWTKLASCQRGVTAWSTGYRPDDIFADDPWPDMPAHLPGDIAASASRLFDELAAKGAIGQGRVHDDPWQTLLMTPPGDDIPLNSLSSDEANALVRHMMLDSYAPPDPDLNATTGITARQTEIAIVHLARKDTPK